MELGRWLILSCIESAGVKCFLFSHFFSEDVLDSKQSIHHQNCRLTSIDVGNELRCDDWYHVCISGLTVIVSWYASGNEIGVDGARAMADAVVHQNCRLTSIDVGSELRCWSVTFTLSRFPDYFFFIDNSFLLDVLQCVQVGLGWGVGRAIDVQTPSRSWTFSFGA
jgi:hypothetical protein